ncbi:MAG: hypothetical protein GC131_06935 [Alphaproteobacteria bacterium]|nr:hypothetical protein [Alphaproteobacteria bacterium]
MNDDPFKNDDQIPDDDFGAADDLGQDQFATETWDDGQPPVDDFADMPADGEPDPAAQAAAPGPGQGGEQAVTPGRKKSSILIMLVVGAVSLLAIGGVGYTFLAGGQTLPPAMPAPDEAAPQPDMEAAAPTTGSAMPGMAMDESAADKQVMASGTIFDGMEGAAPTTPAVEADMLPPITTGAPENIVTDMAQTEDLSVILGQNAPPAAQEEPGPAMPPAQEATAPEPVAAPAPLAETALPVSEALPAQPGEGEQAVAPVEVVPAAPASVAAPEAVPATAGDLTLAALQKDIDALRQDITGIKSDVGQLMAAMVNGGAVSDTDVGAINKRLAKVEEKLAGVSTTPAASGIKVESKTVVTPKPTDKDTAMGEPEKKAAAPAPKKTEPKKAAPKKTETKKVAAKPKPAAKPAPSWVLRGAVQGTAWVSKSAHSSELLEIKAGDVVSGIGTVRNIRMVNGKWQVEGSKGILR